jgi:hypothetical protein
MGMGVPLVCSLMLACMVAGEQGAFVNDHGDLSTGVGSVVVGLGEELKQRVAVGLFFGEVFVGAAKFRGSAADEGVDVGVVAGIKRGT